MAASISYIPEPNERAYYEGLFQAADVSHSGNIGGAEAVQFFARSKLPMDVLKNIWTVADQPSTSSLDRQKFAVAIRLIQLTQNGTKGQGANLAVPPGVTLRPAFLEGVSGATVPLPSPAGPPEAQQQQQFSAPPTPSGQRSVYSAPPPSSQMQMPTPQSQRPPMADQVPMNALVPQDPYAMTPQERGRYEDLFPQYAKPDGFVYGKEAVELFMKSGVDNQVLRELWNAVDKPVDNRLDKLEFAIAMHLIVCISKKNLPPPKGQLPPSLSALKAPPTPSLPPRPEMQHQTPAGGLGPSGLPPLPTGGMSISDAFEGMSVAGSVDPNHGQQQQQQQQLQPQMEQQQPSLPSYVPADQPQQQQQSQLSPIPTPAMPDPSLSNPPPESLMQPQLVVSTPSVVDQAPQSPTPAPSTKELASAYDMGDANQELGKLKDVLQKLQAENISLKAQLGSMSEEEKDVQKELSATVAEIGNLSNTLHSLRQEVLVSKTRLLEASAQLKAAKEQQGVLAGLIQEATETKAAIDEATEAIQNGVNHHPVFEEKKQDALNKSNTFENNLFGYDAGIPQPSAVPDGNRQPALSFDSAALDQSGTAPPPQQEQPHVAPSASVDVSLVNQPPSSLQGNFPDIPLVTTVSSDDEGGQQKQPQGDGNAPEMFENDIGAEQATSLQAPQPASEYPPQQEVSPVPPAEQAVQPPVSEEPPRETSPVPPPQQQAPPPQQYQWGVPTPIIQQQYQPQQAPPPQSDPYQQQAPPPQSDSYQQQQPPQHQSQGGLARPNAIATHSRKESVGGFGSEIMGGSAEPSPVYAAAAAATSFQQENEDAMRGVEELKRKARMAQETANDAEAAHRKLAQEADELRNDADTAEAQARSLRAAADEKKKSKFGGGKKKTMVRDAERAAGDAQEIRKRFMAVQAQAHDAQVVAMETKREAERLKEEAEEAELQAAAAASMKEQQVQQEKQMQAPAPPTANGYPPQQQQAAYGYNGYPPTAAGGHGQQPATQNNGYHPGAAGGYGQPPAAGYPPAANGYGQGQMAAAEYGQPQMGYGGYAAQYNYGAPAPAPMDNGFSQGPMGGGGGYAY